MDAYNHGNPGSAREQRLNYFMENYLPKNEVLYRLPLDIQIEPFWAELSNRRKAGAVLLPLENAAGMPYWYTLTKKMVAASTRLCGEALSCTEAIDPFRMKMTSAMTQEMYFTSFVEGAQVSLEESLDFLGSGAEPSNINEQMVWNNKNAWEQMCKNLYRPMDEGYLKYLAWCLTDGMENCADDYRQTDTHPVAAMGYESYSVPPACRIPDMMRRYAAFLMDPGIHPLVKASAGAAYLLVTRPFPEGNERLSRMVPAAILFRSGYPFFKDISLSGVIAKENYLYYKGMCDIIRDGGDLTYFMEYYLEMLVRALDQMDERKRRKREEEDKELAERERKMAVVPLGAATSGRVNTAPGTAGSVDTRPDIPDNPGGGKKAQEQAGQENGNSPEDARGPDPGKFLLSLKEAESNGCERLVRALPFVRHKVGQNENTFTRKELQEMLGLTESMASASVQALQEAGFAEKTELSSHRYSRYVLNYCPVGGKEMPAEPEGQGETLQWESSGDLLKFIETGPPYIPGWMAPVFREMLQKPNVNRFRAVQLLINVLRDGANEFTLSGWMEKMGLTRSKILDDVHAAIKYGLVSKQGTNNAVFYEISKDPDMAEALRTEQKSAVKVNPDVLKKVLAAFGDRIFTRLECGELLGIKPDGADYHLRRMEQAGIVRSFMDDGRKLYCLTGRDPGNNQNDAGDRQENDDVNQPDEAEAVRNRLMERAGSDPDFAEYWTLPGEEEKTQLPVTTAG